MVVALLKIDKVVSYGAVYKNFIEISGLVVLTTGPLDFFVYGPVIGDVKVICR